MGIYVSKILFTPNSGTVPNIVEAMDLVTQMSVLQYAYGSNPWKSKCFTSCSLRQPWRNSFKLKGLRVPAPAALRRRGCRHFSNQSLQKDRMMSKPPSRIGLKPFLFYGLYDPARRITCSTFQGWTFQKTVNVRKGCGSHPRRGEWHTRQQACSGQSWTSRTATLHFQRAPKIINSFRLELWILDGKNFSQLQRHDLPRRFNQLVNQPRKKGHTITPRGLRGRHTNESSNLESSRIMVRQLGELLECSTLIHATVPVISLNKMFFCNKLFLEYDIVVS